MEPMGEDIPVGNPTLIAPPTAPGDVPPDPPSGRGSIARRAVALAMVAAVVGGIGFAIGRIAAPSDEQQARSPAPRPSTSTAAPQPIPADPSASGLARLGLRESDVEPAVNVLLIPGGNRVSGHPTLDLCNGTFPSEALRRARLQVAEADARGSTTISTESVLYATSAATAQAFTELRATAAHCPARPVASPVGEATVSTKFRAAPDRSWGRVAGVTRLAFDFVSTDSSGTSSHAIAVYLRRGHALTAVYFPQADSPPTPVLGHATIASITRVFATRLAALSRSVAGD